MNQFYTCNAYSESFEIKEKFSIFQKQLVVIGKLKLKPETVEYKCEWYQKDIDPNKPFVVMPLRNGSELLKYTLDNFVSNNLFEFANIIVVDDRSSEDLKKIADKYPVSFLKTFNKIGFNFSMLNNIPALLAHKLGVKTLILWNSDLWIDKIEYFTDLLSKHHKEGCTISGSKLLYPLESLHEEEHSENIKFHFPDKLDGSYKGSIQFGGTRWIPQNIEVSSGIETCFLPYHFRRFSDKNSPRVNCDYATDFITGALQIIDLEWYISNGGLNPSLPKNFQDADICLRAVKQDKKVMYFGRDIHFYHDESYTFYNNKDEKKKDNQLTSDEALFVKIWKDEILNLIY